MIVPKFRLSVFSLTGFLPLVVNLLVILTPLTATAETLLQILPTRIVLDDERSADITLVNRGDSAGNYRLILRNIRTDDLGAFSTIETPLDGELFADKMIRYSPRQVTVEANSKQKVRLVARKPKGLAEGEYRSHLVFRSLPKQQSVLDSSDSEAVDLSLKPIVEVTIPIILRHGELSASAVISDVQLIQNEDGGQAIQLTVNRQGNRSLYGDIEVWWKSSNNSEQRVALAKGISVYVPNQRKIVTLDVDVDPPMVIQGGRLRVSFVEDPSYGGDSNAEQMIDL